MKNTLKSLICLLLAAFMAPVLLSANHPSNYNGLPGDDFSLEGALDLFKRSNTLEEFERQLNSDEYNVNNLDLNNNGRIDYLRVVDHAEGDVHAIVIQAVIEVKRNRYGEAVVQIVGDENLYGTAKIVEPYPYDDVVGTDYYDNYYNHYSPTIYVNAWAWPSVRFIFAPRYVVWVSPYYYNYYPVWYRTWNPYPYHVWHPRTVVYNRYYCVAPNYRIPDAHHYYGPRRVSAPTVHQRTETYVEAHGGRSNFNYNKRSDAVDSPRNRSLDRSEKPALSNSNDRQREQSSTTKQQISNRNTDRSSKPEVTIPNTRQREQNPMAKPQVANPSANSSRQATASVNSKAENNSRQATAPTRETSPRTNNAVNNERRNTKSSVQAPAQTGRKPAAAAPKVNSSTTNSRSGKATGSTGSSAKSSSKSAVSQSRKGKG